MNDQNCPLLEETLDRIRDVKESLVDISLSDVLVTCDQSYATWVCVAATMWYTGSEASHIVYTRKLFEKTFLASGIKGIATMVKGWSNAIRSIMALEPYNTSSVGYCKRAKNCRHALRSAGMRDDKIDIVVSRLDGIAGIPPILIHRPYMDILLGDCDKSVYSAVVPLSNLGRSSPQADRQKCNESEDKFYVTTSVVPQFTFDFYRVGLEYGRLCASRTTPPMLSKIETSTHSSFQFPRSEGGKEQEIRSEVFDNYLYTTVGEIIPTRPERPLYDILGNLVMRPEDWEHGETITNVLYPSLKSENKCDQRFGLFILDWSIRKLWSIGNVTSNGAFGTFGYLPPSIRFSGSLKARVSTLSEEGFKARVITITELCVAIIQIVLRHFLDPYVRADPLVKIGLLSAVKLYDLMVKLSSDDRRGVDNFDYPSFSTKTALSADLTTATDTPPRQNVSTLLSGFVDGLELDHLQGLINLALDLGLSDREFISRRRPPGHVHRNGIMMGEALSGVYLNTMSGVVRCLLGPFMEEFSHYSGSTISDADTFILDHVDWVQTFLNEVDLLSFEERSSQSGDDLIKFDGSDPPEIKRFLILLYRVFGLLPSESTFYSSESYALFTEEAAVKTASSKGWTFIDCPKPRLFRPMDSDGADSIISRIRQIGNICRYIRDERVIERLCDCVDLMIHSHKMIRDRINRYQLVPSFPPELGGLNHPLRYLSGMEVDVPLEDRAMVVSLLGCNDDDFFSIKYSWAEEDLSENNARAMRETLQHVFRVFNSLEEGDSADGDFLPLTLYDESELIDRRLYVGHAAYSRELQAFKASSNLANLDEIVVKVSAGLKFLLNMHESDDSSLNPMIKLRNRRELLISKTREMTGDGHVFTWTHLQSVHFRFQASFKGKCVILDSFLETVGLDNLPSLSIPFLLS